MPGRAANIIRNPSRAHSIFLVAVLGCAAAALAADTVIWKVMDAAILRVDDQPPKDWSVYRQGKKSNAVILQIGERLLLIELHAEQVRELDAAGVQHKEGELVTTKDPGGKQLAIAGWTVRDVGPARRIHFELVGESHVVDLELPQWINRGVTY
jgi:hypothetical protein